MLEFFGEKLISVASLVIRQIISRDVDFTENRANPTPTQLLTVKIAMHPTPTQLRLLISSYELD